MLEDFETDVNGKPLQFDGDASLKQCNAKLNLTKEHIEEYIKCKNDIVYFIENYLYITNIDEGMIKPKLREYQKNIIKSYETNLRTVVLSSRQVGKTTMSIAYILHFIIFSEDKTVGILANDHSMALEIMSNLKAAYTQIPKWMMQGVKVWNVKSVKLENGVKIYAAATSKNALRGRTIALLVLDELSTVSTTVWENFSQSIFPSISSSKTAKILITSTPFGKNQFFKIWTGANDKENWNGYHPIKIDWWEVPGRDEKWKEQALKDLGGDLRKFAQEYGNSFSESGYTLIDGKILSNLVYKNYIPNSINLHQKYKQFLKVYEDVKEGHNYSLALDSSEMTENTTGDPIAIQILDITSLPFQQVATMNILSNISYLETPYILNVLGLYYNTATIFIEQNSTGLEIANTLTNDEYDYPNVYTQKEPLPGYKTTKRTKKLGCSNLKFLLDNDRIELNDFDTIQQLGTFVKKGTTYKADGGYRDDCVMSLIGTIFFMQDKDFDSIAQINYINGTTKKNMFMNELPTMILPMMDDMVEESLDWSWLGNYSINK